MQTNCRRLDGCIAPSMRVNPATRVDGLQETLNAILLPPTDPRHEEIGEEDAVCADGWECWLHARPRKVLFCPLAEGLDRLNMRLRRLQAVGII
eukprot:2529156-Prymnesium_polylepis.2